MGGNGTSQDGALLRERSEHADQAFDLRSWQGLTQVLRAGKESLKDPSAYAEFRNLVLEYTHKGGDTELQKKIHDIARSFGTGKEPVKEARGVAPDNLPLGDGATQNVPAQKEAERRQVVAPRRPTPSFTSQAPKEKAANDEEKEAAPVPQQRQVPIVSEKATKEAEAPHEDTVPHTPAVQEPEAPEAYKSMEEHKARITQIKRSVHDRIGNPATLIDTHNEMGKKYMVALLTALKATGAGSPVGVESAMKALEEAYQNLLNDVKTAPPPETPTPSVEKAETKPVLKPAPKPPVTEAPEHAPEPRKTPTPASVAASFTLHKAEKKDGHSPLSIPGISDHRERTSIPEKPKKQIPVEAVPIQTPMKKEKVEERPETSPAESRPAATPEPAWKINKHVRQEMSAKAATPPSPERESRTTEKTVQQAELFQPEVSKALDTLLHEWTLFSSSGLLGIGPGGVNHPLYKRLSVLSMGEVLAGRWEKADHRVIRVIREYVNAWRHEQGIAYTINETFEHYLRRVVQRILKRQNK